jgi:hypothetical protein
MNHIARLTEQRDGATQRLATVRDELDSLLAYLTSPKFTAPDCDYAHVSTDLLPKLQRIRLQTTS